MSPQIVADCREVEISYPYAANAGLQHSYDKKLTRLRKLAVSFLGNFSAGNTSNPQRVQMGFEPLDQPRQALIIHFGILVRIEHVTVINQPHQGCQLRVPADNFVKDRRGH